MDEQATSTGKISEEAYIFDLYVATRWQEVFNELLDEQVVLPEQGTVLLAECGTGNYALGLASTPGTKLTFVGVDPREALLEIAKAKVQAKKLKNLSFEPGSMKMLPFAAGQFDLVIGDASMRPPAELKDYLMELQRVARPGATVILTLTSHGSFDEFFSIYWETLLELDLLDYYPALEKLITERPTLSEVEEIGRQAGLGDVRTVESKQTFEFDDAVAFLSDPLIALYFLAGWLEIVGESERGRLSEALVRIIDRERHDIPFDVSIKATLIVGRVASSR
jgi:ubiquinone/menaquinone biosynthesis C-methylase UbiE